MDDKTQGGVEVCQKTDPENLRAESREEPEKKEKKKPAVGAIDWKAIIEQSRHTSRDDRIGSADIQDPSDHVNRRKGVEKSLRISEEIMRTSLGSKRIPESTKRISEEAMRIPERSIRFSEEARRRTRENLKNWRQSTTVNERILHMIMATALALGVISMVLLEMILFFETGKIHLFYGVIFVLAVLATSAATYLVIARMVEKTFTQPLKKITEAVSGYLDDKSDGTLDDRHFSDLNIHTGDELERLTNVLQDMEFSLFDYVEDLTRITREKERIGTELELAKRIQTDMLPGVFPPLPDWEDVELYATMDPAKEVGGDFYDFFLVDDDHLALVMADVSGKGIPAALFMMMAKFMISNYAQPGKSPKEILERVNAKICQNSVEEMFVTVWFGILDLTTGEGTAVNAGHEYPILKKPGGDFELLRDRHGFVVGGLDSTHYKEYTFSLSEGASLFLYTDGLPEASNLQNEMFGTQRILDALNAEPDAGTIQLLKNVREAVNAFVGDADPFDDLSMMAVKLRR